MPEAQLCIYCCYWQILVPYPPSKPQLLSTHHPLTNYLTPTVSLLIVSKGGKSPQFKLAKKGPDNKPLVNLKKRKKGRKAPVFWELCVWLLTRWCPECTISLPTPVKFPCNKSYQIPLNSHLAEFHCPSGKKIFICL